MHIHPIHCKIELDSISICIGWHVMVRLDKKKYASKHRNSARVEGPDGSLNRIRNRTCFWLQEDLECSETRFSTGQGIALFQDTLNRKELKSPEDRRKKLGLCKSKCLSRPV